MFIYVLSVHLHLSACWTFMPLVNSYLNLFLNALQIKSPVKTRVWSKDIELNKINLIGFKWLCIVHLNNTSVTLCFFYHVGMSSSIIKNNVYLNLVKQSENYCTIQRKKSFCKSIQYLSSLKEYFKIYQNDKQYSIKK